MFNDAGELDLSPDTTPQGLFVAAARKGNVDRMASLLENHTVTLDGQNKFRETALISAAESGKIKSLKFLIKQGISATSTDPKGRTPLMSAVIYQQQATAKYLLELKKDYMITECSDGDELIVKAVEGRDVAMAMLLLSHGANPNTVDTYGHNLLEIANRNKDPAMVSMLRHAIEEAAKSSGQLEQMKTFHTPDFAPRTRFPEGVAAADQKGTDNITPTASTSQKITPPQPAVTLYVTLSSEALSHCSTPSLPRA